MKMNTKTQQKYKIESKNGDKNDSKKKEKPILSKATSAGALFKKGDPKKQALNKKED